MEIPFEIKAIVVKDGITLALFDSEASANTWIAQQHAELLVKDGEKWVKHDIRWIPEGQRQNDQH